MKSRSNKGQSSMCMFVNCLGNFPDRYDHPTRILSKEMFLKFFFSLRFLLPDYFVLVFSWCVDSKASRW